MAATNYYEKIFFGDEIPIPEPEPAVVPQEQKEWVDLQRDCDIFGSLTDAIYGPDTRSSAEGNYVGMPRADYLGLYGSLNPPSRYISTPARARYWEPPELAAHPFQNRTNRTVSSTPSMPQWLEQPALNTSPEDPQPGFQTPSPSARGSTMSTLLPLSSQPTFQTPTLTPNSSSEPFVLNQLLDTPTPAPRDNRGQPRSSSGFGAVQANTGSSYPIGMSPLVPTSSITSLDPHDPDPPPMGMLRPSDMDRDRYNWIAPQARAHIHQQVNTIWTAMRNLGATHDATQKLFENLRTISNQVHSNERKHRIQFHWLPRILQWLQARQYFPQGSTQYQRATIDLRAVRALLLPDEAAFVQQTIQARTQAVAQGLYSV